MDFITNFTNTLLEVGSKGTPYALWFIFKSGGWIFVAWAIFIGLKDVWLDWRQALWIAKQKFVFLAVDVPKDNEQSFKAVEQIFNQVWGSLGGANLVEKWWQGRHQMSFSFELVSKEGYIQYIIRTPKIFRDLVEASIFAQYPEADITEIEDYTAEFTPESFKDKGYELFGAQFEMINKEFYPIRTYPMFEHSIAQKVIDPLSAMLEMMAKMGKGEQLWYQIIIKPVADDSWKDKAEELVKDLIGVKQKKKKNKFDVFLDKVFETLNFMFPSYKPEKQEEQDYPSNVLYMSKGELETVHAIEIKASKTAFKTKMRMIYLARKDIFSKPKGVSPFVGALKQYAMVNSNGFKPAKKTVTKVDYVRVEQRTFKRQRKILNAFKNRSLYAGVNPDGYLLNVEELASLYHFPSIEVGTASVKTAVSKKAPPPINVPEEDLEEIVEEENKLTETKVTSTRVAPPTNLPV